jgi:hypothetical protein
MLSNGWIKDGNTVRVDYHGHTGAGIVRESRVKYGGSVQYTVDLIEPIKLRWRDELTTTVLVDGDDIVIDFGKIEPLPN